MSNPSFVPTPGSKVLFGRSHGEQTLGEVVKVNRSRVKVRQLECRGTYKSHAVGTIWVVPFNLLSPVSAVVPTGDDAVKAEIERLRAENARLRGETRPVAPPVAKRAEGVILREIRSCYSGLSPENLWMDGEASRSQARRRAAELNRRLRTLFVELGRQVSEDEAYGAVASGRA